MLMQLQLFPLKLPMNWVHVYFQYVLQLLLDSLQESGKSKTLICYTSQFEILHFGPCNTLLGFQIIDMTMLYKSNCHQLLLILSSFP